MSTLARSVEIKGTPSEQDGKNGAEAWRDIIALTGEATKLQQCDSTVTFQKHEYLSAEVMITHLGTAAAAASRRCIEDFSLIDAS